MNSDQKAAEEVFAAVRNNNVELLSKLIPDDNSPLLNKSDTSGKTPLINAIENKSIDAVTWLVRKGCSVNAPGRSTANDENVTDVSSCGGLAKSHNGSRIFHWSPTDIPLMAAVHAQSTEMAKILLETKLCMIDDGYEQINPLLRACADGLTEMVTLLIAYGANVNGRNDIEDEQNSEKVHNDWQYRPLYQAIANDHGDVVEILTKNGAKYVRHCGLPSGPFRGPHLNRNNPLGKRDRYCGSILEVAVVKCSSKVRFLLDTYHDDISPSDIYYALLMAVHTENIPLIKDILDRFRFEPVKENPDKVRIPHGLYLVMRSTIRDCKEENQTLPLLLLERFGRFLAEDILIEKITILLYIAVQRRLVQVVDKLTQLFAAHVDMDQIKNYPVGEENLNKMAADALTQGNLPILKSLTASGLLHVEQYPDALFECIGCERHGANAYETLSWLVTECGCNPRAHNTDGLEPIHMAVRVSHGSQLDSLQALIHLGVDVNAELSCGDGMSTLHFHLNLCLLRLGMNPCVQLMDLLINNGADLSVKNRSGYTPLSLLFWLVQIKIDPRPHGVPLNPVYEMKNIVEMGVFPLQGAFVRRRLSELSFDHAPSYLSSYAGIMIGSHVPLMKKSESLPLFFKPRNMYYRHFFERLINKFGLQLLSMGADTLIGPMHWHHMERILQDAKISWKHVPSLQTCCWSTVRRSIGGVLFQQKVDQLPLPSKMKKYLKRM